jgi:hypothetical protein
MRDDKYLSYRGGEPYPGWPEHIRRGIWKRILEDAARGEHLPAPLLAFAVAHGGVPQGDAAHYVALRMDGSLARKPGSPGIRRVNRMTPTWCGLPTEVLGRARSLLRRRDELERRLRFAESEAEYQRTAPVVPNMGRSTYTMNDDPSEVLRNHEYSHPYLDAQERARAKAKPAEMPVEHFRDVPIDPSSRPN